MKAKSLNTLILFFVTVILTMQNTGCISTKGTIGFDGLKYPASMSAFLYDENYNTVMKGRDLETLHSFKYKTTYWSLGYGLIPLNPDDRISDTLNQMVDQFGGDGIINLAVSIEHGDINKVVSFLMYVPGYMPVFPSGAKITVTGEIVKLLNPESYTEVSPNPDIDFIKTDEIHEKVKELLCEVI